jgi:hypothetical protein
MFPAGGQDIQADEIRRQINVSSSLLKQLNGKLELFFEQHAAGAGHLKSDPMKTISHRTSTILEPKFSGTDSFLCPESAVRFRKQKAGIYRNTSALVTDSFGAHWLHWLKTFRRVCVAMINHSVGKSRQH